MAATLTQKGEYRKPPWRREQSGIANIGFESFLVLLLYAGAAALMLGA